MYQGNKLINSPSNLLINDFAWLGSGSSLLAIESFSLPLIQDTCWAILAEQITLTESQVSLLTEKRKGPLGRYFEALIQTIISLSPQVEICHPNVVVQDGKRTCGELDLLYQIDERWIHLELAVKFYIGLKDRSDPYQWHGPAARDTLGRKLERLYNHQIPLPETSAGISTLDAINIHSVSSEALLMGMLFHPFDDWQDNNFITPVSISENHANGWWIKRKNVSALLSDDKIRIKILEKPEWLSAAMPEKDLINGQTFLDLFNSNYSDRTIMIGRINSDAEFDRGFIVPNDWSPLVSS